MVYVIQSQNNRILIQFYNDSNYACLWLVGPGWSGSQLGKRWICKVVSRSLRLWQGLVYDG